MLNHVVVYDVVLGAYLIGLAKLYADRDLLAKFSSNYRYLSVTFTPYLVLTGMASASFSLGLSPNKILILVLAAFTSLSILLDRMAAKKAFISGFSLGVGSLFLAFLFSEISLEFLAALEVLGIALAFTLPVIISLYLMEKDVLISSLLFTHFLDASSTVIAIRKGLEESRILARLFIEVFGSYGVFLMKFLVFLPVTYYLDRRIREGEKKDVYSLLFWAITAYGFVLAVRNYFLISAA